jgi:hypothetical protein
MAFTIGEGYIEIEKALLAAPVHTLRDRDTLISHILKGFLVMGFCNARYYDVVFNIPARDRMLILLICEGSDVSNNMIGYTIDFADTTIGKKYTFKPEVDSYVNAETSGAFKQWMDDLNLRDKSWIDIPVKYGDELFGVIAVDWLGAPSDIGSEDLVTLDMLGTIIGANLSVIPSHLAEAATQKLNEASKQVDAPEELIGAFLEIICNSLDIAIGAAFRFEWDSGRVTKIQERVHPSIGKKITEFPESYEVGDCLTGHAWQSEEYRYIPSFQSLLRKEADKVAKPSLDRHTVLLGQITSVLYEKPGKREQQFLLRFMNRTDNPALPLLQWHRYAIHEASYNLSDRLENLLSTKRLKNLQEAFSEYTNTPHHALDKVFYALSSEGFPNCAVLWHYIGSNYLSEEYCAGPLFRSWRPRMDRAWYEDPFYSKVCNTREAGIIELSRIEGHQNRDCLIGHLYTQGIRTLLAIPINAAKVKGILVLPLSTSGTLKHKPSMSMLKRSQSERYSTITTYAAIVGNIIESTESQFIASSIAEICLFTLRKLRKSISPDDPLVNFIVGSENQIRNERHLMGKTMDVAMMMATQHQRLQLHFRKSNLCSVLQKAAEAVRSQRRLVDASGRERAYHIVLSQSCEKLGEVVCDPDLLHVVFKNLMDNAVKYSLPRYKEKTIEVNVIGQPQTDMSIVQVKDWGIGVPPEDMERIFRPFYRRELADTRKAIRGLGLGLYIARRIMVAHQGSALCHSSTPTLDDPVRRAAYEGYDVVFEVRIPHILKEGLIEHIWEGWI